MNIISKNESAGHGGRILEAARELDVSPREILDFSANINPLGPPEWLRKVISASLENLVHYPDPEAREVQEALARQNDVAPENILVGAGSTQILFALMRAYSGRRALIPVPSYVDYENAAGLAGLETRTLVMDESLRPDLEQLGSILQGDELVFLGHPNNPTGLPLEISQLGELMQAHPRSIFVIDEAFLDFADGVESLAQDLPDNVILLRSLTKFYAIPGLRLGYALAAPELLEALRRQIPPWSVGVPAQAVGKQLLEDQEYAQESRELVAGEREFLQAELAKLNELYVYPSVVNFLLIRLNSGEISGPELAEKLKARKILIRVCDNFKGLGESYIRIAVRGRDQNQQFIHALREVLGHSTSPEASPTPALMLQGIASDAGKSVLTAGFCRIFRQDGLDVAPFKAQNMALNSTVTPDGLEIARAQALQAQAAQKTPDIRMSPVLLKPSSEGGSQVVLFGEPQGEIDFRKYKSRRDEIFPQVKAAYDELARENQAMVLEGAGSPGEVNLKKNDIVNMAMARHAQAKVLLVGDIDRGGVYASFAGTMGVLSEQERELVQGFLVNRFRGIRELLDDAHVYIQEFTGRPVLGVVPFIRELGLPEEDSVGFKKGAYHDQSSLATRLDVAVLDLPYISNFTDLDALRLEPDLRLRMVRKSADLGRPDILILPGSKSVVSDLKWLESQGLMQGLRELAAQEKTEIIGICGGFQMLGREILDPEHIESDSNQTPGLGLLPISTSFGARKELQLVSGVHVSSGQAVHGYEIHHGQTDTGGLSPLLVSEAGKVLGVGDEGAKVWGTYLHGVFDADDFRRWFINSIRKRKGMELDPELKTVYDLEPALDRLAAILRENVELKRIYKMLGL